mgnify:FL=1
MKTIQVMQLSKKKASYSTWQILTAEEDLSSLEKSMPEQLQPLLRHDDQGLDEKL